MASTRGFAISKKALADASPFVGGAAVLGCAYPSWLEWQRRSARWPVRVSTTSRSATTPRSCWDGSRAIGRGAMSPPPGWLVVLGADSMPARWCLETPPPQ
jgi:hypothetical protein